MIFPRSPLSILPNILAACPIIVEIVDKPERIEAFLPLIDAAVKEGMVTTEKADIKLYRASRPKTEG